VVVNEVLASHALVQVGLGLEEAEAVDPLSDNSIPDVLDTVVLEEQVVATYDGRVDEVKPASGGTGLALRSTPKSNPCRSPQGICTVLLDDVLGV
jgi:hypothetical protein